MPFNGWRSTLALVQAMALIAVNRLAAEMQHRVYKTYSRLKERMLRSRNATWLSSTVAIAIPSMIAVAITMII